MKKIFRLFFMGVICFILAGCGKYGEKDLIKDFDKKVSQLGSYTLSGILEIFNNDEVYSYDVSATYKKENNFRVSLKNKVNNYEQIILRNNEGVYVLTPSLNKNFKFQSEWPFNSSQSYLLQTLLEDLKNNDVKFEEINEGYIIETKANYSSNKDLKNQKIYFDKNKEIYKVEVLDDAGNIKMQMTINSIEYDPSLDTSYFDLNKNVSSESNTSDVSKTIDQIIYPMYIPTNTYLSSQDKVQTENGERIIMNFAGDNAFMLIQEVASVPKDNTIVTTIGEPYILVDSVGVVTDNSVEWVSNGLEYYLTSQTLSAEELVSVAKSLSVMPVGK